MALLREKCRLCRRERVKLFLKGNRCFSPKCPIEKKGAVPPGMHGLKSSVRQSSYGIQLREKQKLKRFYGVTERQCRNNYRRAVKTVGENNINFLRLFESRLDNVVFRLGLAPSRRTARQLVTHGFIRVGERKVTIPSYQVKVGERIELISKGAKLKHIEKWLAEKKTEVPDWLKAKGTFGQVAGTPEAKHFPADVNASLVIEFYSR